MTAAVEARDLFRLYATAHGDAAALQGLTLAVEPGEHLVVLGPSGSGKTSLLRILAGLDRPSAGSVRVFGADLGSLGGRRLAAYRARVLGYVDQHYERSLAPELTARDLVALRLALAGAPRRERLAAADGLLERVGLADRRDARPAELSGGELQRVAVCAALVHRPRLLLADEPTGELDAASAVDVYRLVAELARESGATTMLVSHDPTSTAVADRVVRIRDGRVSEEAAGGVERIVVGRGGWVRLPEELLARAGIGVRARARAEDGRIVLEPAGEQRADGPADAEAPPPVPAGAAAATARGLVKAYGARRVLDGLDLELRGGRLVALVGRSGSGKTTLLRLLAGLDLPDAGTVAVCGEELGARDRAGRAAVRRARIGVVAQEVGLVPFLSARENVQLALDLRGAAGDTGAALVAVGLAGVAERRVDTLSAGERARVAVARAAASRPALLLADEPTARLDAANAVAVAALLARLARESGAAVVCATHDPLVIERADERVELV